MKGLTAVHPDLVWTEPMVERLHVEMARRTLANLGATDIGERPPSWDSPMEFPDDGRERSMLDELGIGAAASVPPTVRRPYEPVSAVSRQKGCRRRGRGPS